VAVTAVTARLVTWVQDVIIDYVDVAVIHATVYEYVVQNASQGKMTNGRRKN
jgi:hypothetical protein